MFGPPYDVWHDGADFATLAAECRRDPALVERMLLAGLGEGDALAAEAVRELPLDPAATRRFVAALRAAPSTPAMAVEVGRSLAALTGDEVDAAAVADVLTGDAHWGVRLDAARAIASFAPTEALIQALEHGLIDADYLVRYHSANSLLRFGGIEAPDIASMPSEFRTIVTGERVALAALRARFGAAARARLA